MTERQMPSADAAERAVAGALLVGAERYGVYDRVMPLVAPEDFRLKPIQTVVSAIFAMEGRSVDLLTVRQHLEKSGAMGDAGGLVAVSALTESVPDIANVERYAELVRDAATRRRVIRDCKRLQDAAYEAESTVALATRGMEIFSEIAATGVAGPEPIRQLARGAIARLDDRIARGDLIGNSIPAPLHELNVITGGFPRGVETLIGARPRVGKTALALQLSIASVEAGKRVLFIELDMSREMLVDRILANLAGVSAFKIRTGQHLEKDEMARISSAAGALHACDDRLRVDVRTRTIARIAALIRREARSGLDLVIVDHIGHVRGGKGDQRYLQLGDVSASLIEVAAETNVAMVALVQLGRDAEHREPTLSDLRESGNLEQDARVVLLLDRPHLRDATRPQCRMEITVAKNEGETGHRVIGHFDLRTQGISDETPARCAFCGTDVARQWEVA